MARTPTNMIPLGFKAPDFTLPDTVSGKDLNLAELAGEKATAVVFICNHCPFVVHVMEQIVSVAKDFEPQGVKFIAISSNDVENYPDDSPELMTKFAAEYDFNFPYLYDESQDVARAYDAACTPDFSVFDGDLICRYRGQLDSARPGNDKPNDGKDLRAALSALVEGREVSGEQVPSLGCNIKWK
jgi:peroxiredoxin